MLTKVQKSYWILCCLVKIKKIKKKYKNVEKIDNESTIMWSAQH